MCFAGQWRTHFLTLTLLLHPQATLAMARQVSGVHSPPTLPVEQQRAAAAQLATIVLAVHMHDIRLPRMQAALKVRHCPAGLQPQALAHVDAGAHTHTPYMCSMLAARGVAYVVCVHGVAYVVGIRGRHTWWAYVMCMLKSSHHNQPSLAP